MVLWWNGVGAGLSRAVKSSCGTLPEMKKGKTQCPGDLFQLCVISRCSSLDLEDHLKGWNPKCRCQDIPHPVCQPLYQSLSHKFSVFIASNSVTAGFGSSFTSNLKWRRKTTVWSSTVVEHQQHASCILIPAEGQQRNRSKSYHIQTSFCNMKKTPNLLHILKLFFEAYCWWMGYFDTRKSHTEGRPWGAVVWLGMQDLEDLPQLFGKTESRASNSLKKT